MQSPLFIRSSNQKTDHTPVVRGNVGTSQRAAIARPWRPVKFIIPWLRQLPRDVSAARYPIPSGNSMP